jgi:hypothetical protein
MFEKAFDEISLATFKPWLRLESPKVDAWSSNEIIMGKELDAPMPPER